VIEVGQFGSPAGEITMAKKRRSNREPKKKANLSLKEKCGARKARESGDDRLTADIPSGIVST